jgi:hypothetical protein
MLCSVGWFRTDVSGLHVGPIFSGQAIQEGLGELKQGCIQRRRVDEKSRHPESMKLVNKVVRCGIQQMQW